jgi:hypothetical protein
LGKKSLEISTKNHCTHAGYYIFGRQVPTTFYCIA